MFQLLLRKKECNACTYLALLLLVFFFERKAGAEGMGYLFFCCIVFGLIYTLFGACYGEECGRFIARKWHKGDLSQIKDFQMKMLSVGLLLGVLGGGLCFLLSIQIAAWLSLPEMELLLRIVALFLPIHILRNLALEWLVAQEKLLTFYIANLMELLLVIVFGSIFVGHYEAYGVLVGELLKKEEFHAYYCTFGMIIALVCTELIIAGVFLVIVLLGSKKIAFDEYGDYRRKGGFRVDQIYKKNFGVILGRFVLCLFLFLSVAKILNSISEPGKALEQLGTITGSLLFLGSVLVCLVSFFVTAVSQKMVNALIKEDRRTSRSLFVSNIQLLFSFAWMPMVLCFVLKDQLAELLNYSTPMVSEVLTKGIIGVFIVLFLIFMKQVWNAFRPMIYVLIMMLGGVLSAVVFQLGMVNTSFDGMLNTSLIGYGLTSIVFFVLATREFGYAGDLIPKVFIPIVDGCLLGGIIFGLAHLLSPHLGAGITVLVCVILGLLLYWLILFMLHLFREQDLKMIPGFRILVSVFGNKR